MLPCSRNVNSHIGLISIILNATNINYVCFIIFFIPFQGAELLIQCIISSLGFLLVMYMLGCVLYAEVF